MPRAPIRVLVIEDLETDYLLTRRMLSSLEGSNFDVQWASTWQAGIEAIRLSAFDVCLLDHRIGGGEGLELLREAKGINSKAPVILLTGIDDYRLDVEAMELGAADFLLKSQLTPALLERSIRYAMSHAKTIEELQRRQHELRQMELRFRSVVQTAADAIILANDSGNAIFWNKGAETVFGYTEEEVIGQPLEMLMPEAYRRRHREGMERFRASGKGELIGRTVELEGLRKDGSIFPLELSLASWRTGEGTFFTAIIRDITQRRRIEEMRSAKEAAEQANRAKSCFLARMSHELRTPLHAIIGFTSLLLQNKRGNLKLQDLDFLERIQVNAKDQVRLINGILDLSKVEAGHMPLEMAPAAVEEIIDDVLKQFEAAKGDIDIVVKVPRSLKPIVTDSRKLKQVLTNLVHNALKFTASGSVTVQVIARSGDSVPERIEVVDSGPGIPADQLKNIFEPFRQFESTPHRRFDGTGLGLSISRSLCDLMGYTLEVQSQPGKGSTFTIALDSDAHRLPRTA